MARPKKEEISGEEPRQKLAVLEQILTENKDYHYVNDNVIDYVVSSGSLTLDIEMGGGIHPGIIRSSGITEGGKTSNALGFARNFQLLHPEKGVVVYVKSEGRLSSTMVERSGVDADPSRFRVVPTNDYEFVIDMMRRLIKDNDNGNLYFFILDSLDA